MGALLALAAATLVSEDVACIIAGVLIHQGVIDPLSGIAACALGIYAGDLALYAVGHRFGARTLTWGPVRRYLTPDRRVQFTDWFARDAAPILLGSRFLPGTRLPLYLVCGALGGSFRLFAKWSFIAVALWTPILVMVSARYATVADALSPRSTSDWPARLAAVVTLLLIWRAGVGMTTRRGRQRWAARIARVWRWEFWPMWVFYAPVALWIASLVVRHRGVRAISAANPGMTDGGLVGESKHEILSHLPPEWSIPSLLIAPGVEDARLWRLTTRLAQHGWAFPLVFKPDVGQRGVGVKVVRSLEEARAYLAREARAVMVQPFHRGPFEAGVFYYRFPGSASGRILSITDKHFPVIVGDGGSTLEELIWADARLRMQADTFLQRHAVARDRVLDAGERLPLAIAGNHAQGTLFRDGRHLITPALEQRIDSIAWSFGGFFIGRFDIRYTDVERFKAGEDLAIVELNGATAESTNIYDPDGSLLGAYRQLFHQWSLVFAIGAANLQTGARSSGAWRVLDLIRAHWASKPAFETSD